MELGIAWTFSARLPAVQKYGAKDGRERKAIRSMSAPTYSASHHPPI
jgi:hypothetical protein